MLLPLKETFFVLRLETGLNVGSDAIAEVQTAFTITTSECKGEYCRVDTVWMNSSFYEEVSLLKYGELSC